jgi:hypothetical protein
LWFGAKVLLALIAVVLITLTTVAVEVRLSALPSDPALGWDFGGE